jgi:hypothetical protein
VADPRGNVPEEVGEETDGLTVEGIRDIYESASAKTSDIARQLSFAGIGFVWVFSGASLVTKPPIVIPNDLIWVGLLFALALTFDFAQYVYKSAVWGALSRFREVDVQDGADDSYEAPGQINWPTLGFFWIKVVLVATSYVLLGIALGHRIR